VIVARLTGANKEYINSVIPHLSRLLVTSLDQLKDADLLIVGHHFEGVDDLLANTQAPVFDVARYETGDSIKEKELVVGYGV
jgi:hypothetical protein